MDAEQGSAGRVATGTPRYMRRRCWSSGRLAAWRPSRPEPGGTLVTTGLMAGVYLAFSIAGDARTGAATTTAPTSQAMRGMNTAILNALVRRRLRRPAAARRRSRWSRASATARTSAGCALALALYVVTLVVTAVVNVPLNNRLDSTEPVEDARALFEKRWVRLERRTHGGVHALVRRPRRRSRSAEQLEHGRLEGALLGGGGAVVLGDQVAGRSWCRSRRGRSPAGRCRSSSRSWGCCRGTPRPRRPPP